jgi:diguanylate cyclase (GGDEF)-like protein
VSTVTGVARRSAAAVRLRRHDGGVLGLVLAMLAAAAVLWWVALPRLGPATGQRWMPWWAIGLLFAAAEIFVLHVQVRREARTMSLSDLPLVIGLFLVTPGGFVLGRTLPALAVFVLVRRQPLIKAAFNAALMLVEALVGLAIFDIVLGHRPPQGPLAWGAAYAAAAACGVVSAGLVACAIAIRERRSAFRDIARTIASGAGWGLLVATPALVAVEAIGGDRKSLALLAVCAVTLFLGYRAYASLSERHLGLERLYRFSQVLGQSANTGELHQVLLHEARTLLRAEFVEISLVAGGTGVGVRISMDQTGHVRQDKIDDLQTGDWLWARTINEEEPLVMPRGSNVAAIRRYLDRRGWREAVVVPMRGEKGVIGTLAVADRLGDVRTFDDADARLLATVANQASVALENGRLIDRLRHDALHDALTGLPNRVLFREILGRSLSQHTATVAVMMLDLDGFKDINDTLGHEYGDLILCELGTRLLAVVGADGIVARFGGDEFAVLLDPVADADAAVAVANGLLHSLEQPVYVDGMNLEVGGAIGVTIVEGDADETTVLRQADLAMYAAKAGSMRVAVFEPAYDSNSRERLAIAGELRRALQDGLLTVHVQPKARLDTREVISVESLLRWQHPTRGYVSPEEFIPLAERSGLIRPLTSFVLEESIAAAAGWATTRACGIAVNISTRSLIDADLAPEIERLLDIYGLAPELLTLEITEGSIMGDPERTVAMLERLHALGVRISVDDFGTGYSSLSYLRRLPVGEVKIDRSFIVNLGSADNDTAIVRAVIDLGANLGLEVVAEGVEDEQSWRALAALGCAVGQGYHLSRPMPIEEFPLWLRRYDAQRSRVDVACRAGA